MKYVIDSEKQNKLIDLLSIQKSISITIELNDLLLFADHLIESAKKEWEATIAAKKAETYVSPAEVSQLLHVDKSTLWRWAKTGYLVPVEVGGKRLYKQSDLDKILKK